MLLVPNFGDFLLGLGIETGTESPEAFRVLSVGLGEATGNRLVPGVQMTAEASLDWQPLWRLSVRLRNAGRDNVGGFALVINNLPFQAGVRIAGIESAPGNTFCIGKNVHRNIIVRVRDRFERGCFMT